MGIVQYNFPTKIRFGVGACSEASTFLREQGLSRPLLVTDAQVATLPFFSRIKNELSAQGLIPESFDGVMGNPVASQVTAGLEAYHAHGADALVLIGGGAALDVGKVIALMVNHPGELFDYEDGKEDARVVDQPIPFMVAIPTTAGTGSEVGRASVISDDETKAKRIIFDPVLLPPLVLLDPELTIGLPPAVTAQTGFDALTHNIEAYLSPGFHPLADGIAREGVMLCAQYLVEAYENGENLTARGGMLMASLLGATAFQKGLGITHSCAHALSTFHDTHHGLANALMLPACLDFNNEVVEDRLADLGRAIGLEGTQAQLSEKFRKWVIDLRKQVGIADSLAKEGISISDQLIQAAFDDPVHGTNPRKATLEDFQKIFEQAL